MSYASTSAVSLQSGSFPSRIEFIGAIPRTATGKFKKTALRERFVQAVS